MSAHHLMSPTEEMSRHNLSLGELHEILARYKADDDSWPCGLVNLRSAIKLKAPAEPRAT
jgi:hypothetical protein